MFLVSARLFPCQAVSKAICTAQYFSLITLGQQLSSITHADYWCACCVVAKCSIISTKATHPKQVE